MSKPTPIGLPLQILFLDQLSAQERKGLLRQARKQRAEALDQLNKYRRLLIEYGLETLRREIALL